MPCTPPKLPESVDICSADLIPVPTETIEPRDVDAAWSDNPLEHEQTYYEAGIPNVCSEYKAAHDSYYEEAERITEQYHRETFRKGNVTIEYYKELEDKGTLIAIANMADGLNRLFPNTQNKVIALTGLGSAAGSHGDIDLSPLGSHIISTYVHEFGHIAQDDQHDTSNLQRLLLAAWDDKNYLIIKDSTYEKPVSGQMENGHIENQHELFASTFRAYFYDADQFVRFIKNASTPDAMKNFGLAMWSYMRDRVFHGKVFTADKKDPFPDASYSKYLSDFNKSPLDVVLAAYRGMDELNSTKSINDLRQFINISGVIAAMPSFLRMITDDGKLELRYFLYQCMYSNRREFLAKAKDMFAGSLPQPMRLELINIIALDCNVWSFFEDARPVLEAEAANGTENSKVLAQCILARYGRKKSK